MAARSLKINQTLRSLRNLNFIEKSDLAYKRYTENYR